MNLPHRGQVDYQPQSAAMASLAAIVGLGFRVLGFRGLGFRVRVKFRVQGSGFRV